VIIIAFLLGSEWIPAYAGMTVGEVVDYGLNALSLPAPHFAALHTGYKSSLPYRSGEQAKVLCL
jgi:hypothetical protein